MTRPLFSRSRKFLKQIAAAALVAAMPAAWAAGALHPSGADVVIYGATPGGIVTAVRAAREGLKVVLVSPYPHIGGILTNGLLVFDTVYQGRRAPLYDEVRDRITSHYPAISIDYGHGGFEPHVVEEVFEALLRAENNIRIYRGYYPASTNRNRRILKRVNFRSFAGKQDLNLAAPAFVDASYEGDLAAISGVAMTVGREGRDRYGEPHAGVIFTKIVPMPNPHPYDIEGLMLSRQFQTTLLMGGSTGAGDKAVQAYNFRPVLTDNPANRIQISKPDRYERDLYVRLYSRVEDKSTGPRAYPIGNHKFDWWEPILIEGSQQYPEASWKIRREIIARHRDFALGYLWFLQHDSEVPSDARAKTLEYGLPKDEFQDNGGFPREMYVREARRMIGRYVFTEHDARVAPGMKRAPAHADSIAITEWPLDSHPSHWMVLGDSYFEGKVEIQDKTRPGQIPFRTLLPKELDNLLVTVCLSASHIGWGTIRVEPTLMHLGESAAYALVLAHRQRRPPAMVPVPQLQRLLVDRGIMITFFNDVRYKNGQFEPEDAAAQLGGVEGRFPTYWARQ